MALIILVRHGESEANVRGILSHSYDAYPLTELGRKEVLQVAVEFSGAIVDELYSSPVLRARQTAEIISSVIHHEVQVDERIRESSMGIHNNMPYFEVPKGGREQIGLESWLSIEKRMRDFADDAEGKIIVVSHQITIRALLASYLGLGEPESYGIDIGRATVSAIDTDTGRILCVGAKRVPARLLAILKVHS